MKSRDFVYWLQGYFEIGGHNLGLPSPGLSAEQVETIRRHLAMVFAHEIDPAMGSPAHNSQLSGIHNPAPSPMSPGDIIIKC